MRAAIEAFAQIAASEPPPSSNGPPALRGDDLARALAEAEQAPSAA